jgi:Trk K+ transport system NAD-binding subunit
MALQPLRPSTERRSSHTLLRWARWRVLAMLVVFGSGLLAFQLGVGVTERAEVLTGGILTKAYYTLGLFFLGGLDIGVPSGGSTWARGLLWCAYFTAPIVTASAVLEAATRVLQPHALRSGLSGHIVIGGCGRLSMLYMRALRDRDPAVPLVVIERHLDNPHLQIAAERYRARIVHGDLANQSVLGTLKLQRARRVLLFTGDDHVNLDAASRMVQLAPHLASHAIVHVADLRLLRVIERRGLLNEAYMFNSYRTAAHHLVESELLPQFTATSVPDIVILAGFGRFGQTVLDELQKTATGEFERVIIVDRNALSLAAQFADQIGFAPGCVIKTVEQGIQDPRTWQAVAELAGHDAAGHAFVVGSGDDNLNLRTAVTLTEHNPTSLVVARAFHRSEFTDAMSTECGFKVVSTAHLLLDRFEHEGFFER